MKHDAWLTEQLHDDAFAAAYLTQAAQDLEPAPPDGIPPCMLLQADEIEAIRRRAVT